MTRLSRLFLAVSMVLLVAFVALVVDGTTGESSESLHLVAAVTRLPGPALSVSYFEPRFRQYANQSVTISPGMRPLNAMDFVYGR